MDGADPELLALDASARSPLGRDGERRALRGALRAAAEGRGGLVVVEGPAGIGKTTLLEEAAAVAPELGLDVLAARGDQLERDHPLGVVRQLLQRAATDSTVVASAGPAAAPAVAVLDPASVPSPGGDPGFPVLHGCWWLLQGLAAARPRLVVVDDVHWADPASLRVLAYLAGRLEELPVVLVAGLREPDDDADDAPPPLARVPRLATLTLSPLTVDDAGRVVARRLGVPVAAGCATACHEVTGGNPFLLAELASALQADGIAPDDAAAPRVRELGPRSVARALLLRLGRRGPDPLALARALAVLGRESDLGVAGPLAGLEPAAASAAADILVRGEVLADAYPLRFRHPIVRSSVLGDVGPGGRAALHASAADLLRRTGAPDADVAVHLLHAPAAGSDTDAATLLRAGQQALARGAPVEALRFLGRALEEPPAVGDRPDVLAGLAEAGLHARVDVRTAGERLAESAATTTEPGRRVERWLLLAQLVTVGRGIPAAVGLLEEVLRQTPDEEDRRRVAVDLVGKALLHPDTRARGDALARSAPGVLTGDTTLDRLERCNLAWGLALAGAPAAEVEALAGPALDGGRLSRTTGPSAPVYQGIAALSQVDAVDVALACADAAVETARERHQTIGLFGALGTRASIRWRRGELRECADDARASLDLPGVPPPFQLVSAGWAALAALAADDPEAAEEALAAVDGAPVVENVNVHVFEAAGALVTAARGDDGAAHVVLEDSGGPSDW
ncbi:AAA family ATPase [Patulibacter sp. NPDC049589]|uniref:ATP-binding protein n=1 Tax=Patulibacter sp. NPDC049589 TaxID=3154731 RepID=UPI003445BC1A